MGPNVFQKNRLTPFLETQAKLVSKMTRTYGVNDKSVYIDGSTKLYAHLRQLTELLTFFVCERRAVRAIAEYGFCDQFGEWVYQKECSVGLNNRLTVAFSLHYMKQQSARSINGCFCKCKGPVSPKVTFSQRFSARPFSQVILTAQREREQLILTTLKHYNGKHMKCSAAQRVQQVMWDVLFWIIVDNFI